MSSQSLRCACHVSACILDAPSVSYMLCQVSSHAASCSPTSFSILFAACFSCCCIAMIQVILFPLTQTAQSHAPRRHVQESQRPHQTRFLRWSRLRQRHHRGKLALLLDFMQSPVFMPTSKLRPTCHQASCRHAGDPDASTQALCMLILQAQADCMCAG